MSGLATAERPGQRLSERRTVRSFIDLRAFARDPGAGTHMDRFDDPFLAARRSLPLANGPVSVAVLSLNGGHGRVDRHPRDEVFIVTAGAILLDTADGQTLIAAGRSAVIPRGMAFTWQAKPSTQAIVMGCANSPAGADRIVPIDEAAALEPSGPPLASLLVGPTPSCRNHTDYRSANGEFLCGTWDSTPYHRRSMPYRHYELMHLLAGSVAFEDAAGRRATFAAGDIFLVEQGAECSWLSETQVKKVYAIYRPA